MLKEQKKLCADIAGSISEISKLVAEGLNPKEVCAKLGLCPSRQDAAGNISDS